MKNIAASSIHSDLARVLRKLDRRKTAAVTDARGNTTAYLVDSATFENMQSRIHLLEGIARGERAILEGRTFTHEEAKRKMARWLKKK